MLPRHVYLSPLAYYKYSGFLTHIYTIPRKITSQLQIRHSRANSILVKMAPAVLTVKAGKIIISIGLYFLFKTTLKLLLIFKVFATLQGTKVNEGTDTSCFMLMIYCSIHLTQNTLCLRKKTVLLHSYHNVSNCKLNLIKSNCLSLMNKVPNISSLTFSEFP